MQEPLLHSAVIQNQMQEVLSLAQDPEKLHMRNSLGFTAVELAKLLNREECLKILQQSIGEKTISVMPRRHFKNDSNKWSQAQFEEFFDMRYLSHLHFPDYATLKDAIKNCPWILSKSRWGDEYRQLAKKYRNEIDSGYIADVTIQWIDDEMGYGLFANGNFPSNTYIGEYTGVVRRLSRWRPDSNAYCLQYPTRFFTWKNYVVDAFKEGNELRFVNHSDDPNLQPMSLVDRGLQHLIFLTNQDIKAGEELTFNYGPDFWRHRKKESGARSQEQFFTTEDTENTEINLTQRRRDAKKVIKKTFLKIFF